MVEVTTEDQQKPRATAPVTIGTRQYTARAPKLNVWLTAAQRITAVSSGQVNRIQLNELLTELARGGLSKEDWAGIQAELADPDSDLDSPDIWAAGIEMIAAFEENMRERASAAGLRIPDLRNLLARPKAPQDHKAPAKKAPAAKPPAKKASKKATARR